VGVVALVLSFGSSTNLASAYGIAVVGTMIITTMLATVVFYRNWKWPLWLVVLVSTPLLALEGLFLVSNMIKVLDGGWVPLVLAAVVALGIWSWIAGTNYVQKKARLGSVTVEALIKMLDKDQRLATAPGTAVFLTSDPETAPSALMHNLKHNHVLHSRNMIVTVKVSDTPYVAESERLQMTRLSDRFTRIFMSFGYMEQPNVPRALMLARKQGEKFDIMSTSFFLNRRSFRSSANEGLPVWQETMFTTMARGASNATDFYRLPANRVIELGEQVTI